MANGDINRNGATIRIDDNGAVQVEPAAGEDTTVDSDLLVTGDAPGGIDISDDGTLTVVEASDANFGTNLSVVDDGDGTVTINATGEGTGEIALEEYATAEDVPAPESVTQPTIAYVADVGDGTDDYLGVFES